MMRRLVERHRGILPLDTAESIWRVIIATFTYVQAPFRVHADLSAGDAGDARHRALPFRLHGAVRAAYGRGRRGRGGRRIQGRSRPGAGDRDRRAARGGARSKATTRRRSSRACPSSSAPTIRPRCRCSRSRAPHPDAIVPDVEMWSVRVSGWGGSAGARRRRARRGDRRAGRRLRRRGAARLGAAGRRRSPTSPRRWSTPAPRCAPSPRRQPRDPLYGRRRRRPAGPDRALTGYPETACQCPLRVRNRAPACSTISAYVPGKSSAPGVAKVFKLSSNETPLGPSPKAIAAYRAVGEHLEDYPDGVGDRRCARRSAAPSGSIPTASSAAPAPTICSTCWRAPISPTATRRSTPRTAFWSIRSRRSAPAPRRWSRRRRTTPPTSTRSSRR